MVTPQDADTFDPETSRQYSVGDLDADEDYRVTLVNSDNVDVDANGVVTFTEDGTTGLAAAGDVDSDITVVNGVATAAPATDTQSVGGISPTAGGNIEFTVTTEDTFEEFVPVIYVDGGDNTRLEIDEDGEPEELFGVGGAITVLPDEAADGEVVFPVEILAVDKDANFIVGEDNNGVDNVYFYDDNDEFFDDPAAGAADELTLAEFEAILTAGDNLDDDTVYQDNADLESTFVLENLEPAQLTVTATDGTDTTVELTIEEDDVNEGATVEVFYADDDAAGDPDPDVAGDEDEFTVETFTVDEDADADDFQVTVTGLDDGTDYDFFVRQVTDDGEEGPFSARIEVPTEAAGFDADVLSNDAVVTNSNLLGTSAIGDVIEIGFSRAIDDVNTAGDEAQIRVVDADGDTAVIDCATDTCTRNVTARTFEGEVYDVNELLTITLAAALADGTDPVNYPATVTDQSGIHEVNDATNEWNLADSPDTILEVDELAASEDDIAPEMVDAVGVDAAGVADTITVDYTEAIQCVVDGDVTQFEYNDTDGGDVNPTSYTCATGDLVLTFANLTVDDGDDGTLTYTEGADVADHVEDAADNDAVSPDSVVVDAAL